MENGSSQKMACRKDMQCTCAMCLASFQATWDLRRPSPLNNAFQAITNLGEVSTDDYRTPTPPRLRKGKENHTPRSLGNDEKVCRPVTPFLPLGQSYLSFEPTRMINSPEWKETEQPVKVTIAAKRRTMWLNILVCLVGLTLAILIPKAVVKVYSPALTGESVMGIVQDSMVRTRLADRFDLIQWRLSRSLPGRAVSNCTGSTATWSLKDAGHLIHSQCKFFSSAAESVIVWGYPIETAGILGRSVQDRYFIVLTGRLFEWREGQIEHKIHEKGGKWMLQQWAASVIYLEEDTWIVEYKQGILSGLGSFSGIVHLFKQQVSRLVLHMKGALDVTTLAYSLVTNKAGSEVMPT